jgi:hypothetical protein
MAMPFMPGAISQYPSTADSPGLSRTLPFEAILSGFRAAGVFSAFGGVGVETLVEGVAATWGTDTGFFAFKAVRMSNNAIKHTTRQRRMRVRRMVKEIGCGFSRIHGITSAKAEAT